MKFLFPFCISFFYNIANAQSRVNINDSLSAVSEQLDSMIFYVAIILLVMGLIKLIFLVLNSDEKPQKNHKKYNNYKSNKIYSNNINPTAYKLAKTSETAPAKNPLYVEEKTIDTLIDKILHKSSVLLTDENLKNEFQYKLIVEKSVTHYMPKVINAYKNIPLLQRHTTINSQSAHEMAHSQLTLIFKGLEDIEAHLLTQKHHELKVSGRFLEQVFEAE